MKLFNVWGYSWQYKELRIGYIPDNVMNIQLPHENIMML